MGGAISRNYNLLPTYLDERTCAFLAGTRFLREEFMIYQINGFVAKDTWWKVLQAHETARILGNGVVGHIVNEQLIVANHQPSHQVDVAYPEMSVVRPQFIIEPIYAEAVLA